MSNTAKLLFSGDFVYSKDVIENDFEISSDFSNIIKNHDIFCCNLEGPIINENCRQIKKIGPNIYNSESSVKKLNKAGANLFCLANNHILDYGQNGLSNR